MAPATHSHGKSCGKQLFPGLSSDDLDQVHGASLKILERTGIFVEDDMAREIFSDHGATVNREGKIVKMPEKLVEDAMASTPDTIFMAARNPSFDRQVSKDVTYFVPFSGQVNIVDPFTQSVRRGEKADIADMARLCDALDQVDMVTRVLHALDYPASLAALHNADALLHNTSKHILIGIEGGWEAKKLRLMANAVSSESSRLNLHRPFSLMVALSSPLKFTRKASEAIIESARAGFNTFICSMAIGGASSPIHLASTLALSNAEILAGIVLNQLVNTGAPVVYSNYSTTMDLRTGVAPLGTPETAIIASAASQLAAFYQIPSLVSGVMTDSNIADAQATHEKTLTGFKAASAGANIIIGTGGLGSGLIFDPVQLVIDNEIVYMIRRTQTALLVNPETLALDAIHEIDHCGDYLSHDSTLQNMAISSKTELIDRQNFAIWEEIGAPTIHQRAIPKTQDLLRSHKPQRLSPRVSTEIKGIIAEAEMENDLR